MGADRKPLPPALKAAIDRASKLVALAQTVDLVARDAKDQVWRFVIVVQHVARDDLRWGLRVSGPGRTFVVQLADYAETHYLPGRWVPAPRVPGWAQRRAIEWVGARHFNAAGSQLGLPGAA